MSDLAFGDLLSEFISMLYNETPHRAMSIFNREWPCLWLFTFRVHLHDVQSAYNAWGEYFPEVTLPVAGYWHCSPPWWTVSHRLWAECHLPYICQSSVLCSQATLGETNSSRLLSARLFRSLVSIYLMHNLSCCLDTSDGHWYYRDAMWSY